MVHKEATKRWTATTILDTAQFEFTRPQFHTEVAFSTKEISVTKISRKREDDGEEERERVRYVLCYSPSEDLGRS